VRRAHSGGSSPAADVMLSRSLVEGSSNINSAAAAWLLMSSAGGDERSSPTVLRGAVHRGKASQKRCVPAAEQKRKNRFFFS